MARLTIRVDDGLDDIYFAVASDPDGAYNIHDLAQYRTENEDLLTDIADRLAAYEDTDLEPEEIHQMQRQWRDTEKHLRDNCIHLRAELEQVKRERDAAVKCISSNCSYIEFVEGGISYCAINGAGCDDCEHIWHKTKES